ncbi:3-oxoadipate enol-lactonase [Roseicitreum antarcticum]|uniref:3-oxoadipate enol-lactonase n=1 Tax=Roseicitreum antarcticum TaxID=564137 RepID=A0A1H2THP8_9RHOB|nr:3-oxoadipate enol-lactonase [Roseicitreum antarcticum]SDW42769.1 3-oxoadipate enol-lactonase [Roseicitreum antarcticum]
MIPHHLISGLQDGPPVVLSHSLATNLSMWDAILAPLEQQFRVIRYDARGHGASSATGNDYSLQDLVADVTDLLDHLAIERAHFVGLSMGGMVGMGLGIDHADRLLRLVVCDARADAPPTYRNAWDTRIAAVMAGGMAAIAGATVDRWFTDGFKSDALAVARMRMMVEATPLEGYVGCARALKDLDYKRRLGAISVPVLYLVGDQDLGAPPEEMRAMQRLTPGARFLKIAGAGHISVVEQPVEAGTAISDFLSDKH